MSLSPDQETQNLAGGGELPTLDNSELSLEAVSIKKM